jgi:hypothetical protein
MVAPVTLEAGATVGAGSVISRTAPADTLTVARARQVTIAGWKRPQKKRSPPSSLATCPLRFPRKAGGHFLWKAKTGVVFLSFQKKISKFR